MNNAVWKYFIEGQTSKIRMPIGADVLSAESQGDEIVIYSLVNTKEVDTQEIEIKIFGTGQPIELNIKEYTFLDTLKLEDGSLMLHVFYKRVR